MMAAGRKAVEEEEGYNYKTNKDIENRRQRKSKIFEVSKSQVILTYGSKGSGK
jgi:hypothetical protein